MLLENSLYTTQQERDDLIKNKTLLATHFWINFLGISILYNIDPNNAKLMHYLRSHKVQLTGITDSNSDFTLIVKLMDDAGMIPQAKATEITRFNALLKQGKLTSVDQNILRGMITRLNVNHIKPGPLVRNWVVNFETGKINLSDNGLIKFLYHFAKKNKMAPEFIDIAKHMISKIDDDDIKNDPASAQVTPAVVPVGNITLDPATKAVAAKVATKAKLTAVLKSTVPTLPAPVAPAVVVKDKAWYLRNLAHHPSTREDGWMIFYKLLPLDSKEIKKTLKLYDFTSLGTSAKDYFVWLSNQHVAGNLMSPNTFSDATGPRINTFPVLTKSDIGPFQMDNIYQLMDRKNYEDLARTFLDKYISLNIENTVSFWNFILENSSRTGGARSWKDKRYYWSKEPVKSQAIVWALEEPEKLIANILKTTSEPKNASKILDEVGGYPYRPANLKEYLVCHFIGGMHPTCNEDWALQVIPILNQYNKESFKTILQKLYGKFSSSANIRKAFSEVGLLGTNGFTDNMQASDFGDKVVLARDIVFKLLQDIKDKVKHSVYADEILAEGNLYNFCIKHGAEETFTEALIEQARYSYANEVIDIMIGSGVDFTNKKLTDRIKKSIFDRSTSDFGWNRSDIATNAALRLAYEGMGIMPFVNEILGENFRSFFYKNFGWSIGAVYRMYGVFWGFPKLFQEMEKFLPDGEYAGDISSSRLYNIFDANKKEFKQNIGYAMGIAYAPTILKFYLASYKGKVELGSNLFDFERELNPANEGPFFHGKELDEAIKECLANVDPTTNISGYYHTWIIKMWMRYKEHAETQELAEWLKTRYTMENQPIKVFVQIADSAIKDEKIVMPEFVKTNFEETLKALDGADAKYAENSLKESMGSMDEFLKQSYPDADELLAIKTKILNKTSCGFRFDIFTNSDDYDIDTKIKVVKEEAQKISRLNSQKDIKDAVANNLGMVLLDIYNSKKKKELDIIFPMFGGRGVDANGKPSLLDKTQQARLQLRNMITVLPMLKMIVGSNTPIKPEVTLTDKELHNLLRLNNFDIADSTSGKTIKMSKTMSNVEYFDKIIDATKDIDKGALSLKVTAVSGDTPDILEKRTAELFKYYTPNSAHGDVGLKITHSYDVHLTYPEFDHFIKDYPKPTIIPGFHGTGTVAASMILRFGFKVMTQSLAQSAGVSYAGKMLGEGVYFGGFVDKTCGYVRDKSDFSRRWGQVGYLLELEAYIGQENVHHRKAGNGGDSIRSIEYCVPNARAQLKIIRAHRVVITSRREVEQLYNKYFKGQKIAANESKSEFPRMKRFMEMAKEKSELMEEIINEAETAKNVIRFEFAEPAIPIDKDKWLNPDDFQKKYCNKKMTLTDSQYGFEIEIDVDTDLWLNVTVPDTDEFMITDPDGLFSQWLFFFNQAIGKVIK